MVLGAPLEENRSASKRTPSKVTADVEPALMAYTRLPVTLPELEELLELVELLELDELEDELEELELEEELDDDDDEDALEELLEEPVGAC